MRDSVFTLPAVPADQPAAVRITSIEGPLADALRAEGAAAERARIRQVALSEASRLAALAVDGYGEPDSPEDVLRDFAALLGTT